MAADQERADRIRALKQGRPDLTWRRIAEHVGVTERSATDWQAKGGIEYDNAKKLAELFEVDIDYIWRGPNEEDRAPSPFAGRDALADRIDKMHELLAAHAQRVEDLLDRQTEILERIEAAQAHAETASQRLDDSADRLAETAARAGRVLRDGTEAPLPKAPKPAAKGNRVA